MDKRDQILLIVSFCQTTVWLVTYAIGKSTATQKMSSTFVIVSIAIASLQDFVLFLLLVDSKRIKLGMAAAVVTAGVESALIILLIAYPSENQEIVAYSIKLAQSLILLILAAHTLHKHGQSIVTDVFCKR